MSVEMACTCDGLPAHSHIFARQWIDGPQAFTLASNGQPPPVNAVTKTLVTVDTGEIRIWVDWKAVAREISVGAA